ncbi:hypothetical protein G3H63_09300 [Microbacterium resistens]|uniref:hypothetical protein n=1 Tax=Microbacterium resistens TaxID=156977 RepID=UPI001C5A32C0|nr:hypothetical protein [Microbacterium resistens]MBW1639265.1 hypothetical protein [Microbacterium resistens]
MPWFRVDDGLAFNMKAISAGNEALGLWVRAGSWSMQQLSDGFIPAPMVAALGGSPEATAALVTVGLWHDAEGGFQFHDWAEYQPTREQLLAERAAATERKRRSREASRRKSQQESRRDSRGTDAVIPGRTAPAARMAAPPDPFCPKHMPTGPKGSCRKCGDARMALEAHKAAAKARPAPVPFTVVPGVLCPDGGHTLLADGTCTRCEYRGEVA